MADDVEDAVPESESESESDVAEAIREVFTTQLMGGNVANALYEVSKSLDRIAAAIEANQQPDYRR